MYEKKIKIIKKIFKKLKTQHHDKNSKIRCYDIWGNKPEGGLSMLFQDIILLMMQPLIFGVLSFRQFCFLV